MLVFFVTLLFYYFDAGFKCPGSFNVESKIIARVFVRRRLECVAGVEC